MVSVVVVVEGERSSWSYCGLSWSSWSSWWWFFIVLSSLGIFAGISVENSRRAAVYSHTETSSPHSCRDMSFQSLHVWLLSACCQNWVWLRLIFVGFHIAMEWSSQSAEMLRLSSSAAGYEPRFIRGISQRDLAGLWAHTTAFVAGIAFGPEHSDGWTWLARACFRFGRSQVRSVLLAANGRWHRPVQ